MPELLPGVPITLAGKEYVVPCWNNFANRTIVFPAIEKINTEWGGLKVENITMTQMAEQMGTFQALYQAALKRNYPEVTMEWMDENLTFPDFNEMVQKFPAVMELNGFAIRPVASGEARSGSTN